MPSIAYIEAAAKVLGTDIDLLLNFTPEEAEAIQKFKAMERTERNRAMRVYAAGQDRESSI